MLNLGGVSKHDGNPKGIFHVCIQFDSASYPLDLHNMTISDYIIVHCIMSCVVMQNKYYLKRKEKEREIYIYMYISIYPSIHPSIYRSMAFKCSFICFPSRISVHRLGSERQTLWLSQLSWHQQPGQPVVTSEDWLYWLYTHHIPMIYIDALWCIFDKGFCLQNFGAACPACPTVQQCLAGWPDLAICQWEYHRNTLRER